MTRQIYMKLLSAIEELRNGILEINPTANTAKLDHDINSLYEMLNAYVEFAAHLQPTKRENDIAQTIRLRNLIRQQGAGSWQRVFESELEALSQLNPRSKKENNHDKAN